MPVHSIGEDARVNFVMEGQLVTAELVDLLIIDGRKFAVLALINPPDARLIASRYKLDATLDDECRAKVEPIGDADIEATVLAAYQAKLAAAA